MDQRTYYLNLVETLARNNRNIIIVDFSEKAINAFVEAELARKAELANQDKLAKQAHRLARQQAREANQLKKAAHIENQLKAKAYKQAQQAQQQAKLQAQQELEEQARIVRQQASLPNIKLQAQQEPAQPPRQVKRDIIKQQAQQAKLARLAKKAGKLAEKQAKQQARLLKPPTKIQIIMSTLAAEPATDVQYEYVDSIGVAFKAHTKMWEAGVTVASKTVHIALFKTRLEAQIKYNEVAILLGKNKLNKLPE